MTRLGHWQVWRALLVGIVIWGAGGCGYRLTGQNSYLLKNVKTVYVEPFLSRSRDVGIDKELTSALRSEFYRRGQLKLVDQAEQADVILSGLVRSLESQVASVSRQDEVLEYEAVMTLDVTLRRREPNEVLWRAANTRLTQLYAGSRAAVVTTSSEFRTGTFNTSDVRRLTDIQLTEMQSQAAREQLMDRFARDLHQRIVEGF
ncbi:MAG: hypothetical protein FJ145_19525 [Deltaproteobacteria bacterium]|nr:hypothetical protein [Deltaproteobacteria bacterium]